jgi:hypothetical protein
MFTSCDASRSRSRSRKNTKDYNEKYLFHGPRYDNIRTARTHARTHTRTHNTHTTRRGPCFVFYLAGGRRLHRRALRALAVSHHAGRHRLMLCFFLLKESPADVGLPRTRNMHAKQSTAEDIDETDDRLKVRPCPLLWCAAVCSVCVCVCVSCPLLIHSCHGLHQVTAPSLFGVLRRESATRFSALARPPEQPVRAR